MKPKIPIVIISVLIAAMIGFAGYSGASSSEEVAQRPSAVSNARYDREVAAANASYNAEVAAFYQAVQLQEYFDTLYWQDILRMSQAYEAAQAQAAAEAAARKIAKPAQGGVSSAGAKSAPSGGGGGAGGFLACTRGIESGGNYSTNTGNGYYGAYQFDDRTWAGQGGTGHASDASPAEQDARASSLYAQRGNQPWGGRC